MDKIQVTPFSFAFFRAAKYNVCQHMYKKYHYVHGIKQATVILKTYKFNSHFCKDWLSPFYSFQGYVLYPSQNLSWFWLFPDGCLTICFELSMTAFNASFWDQHVSILFWSPEQNHYSVWPSSLFTCLQMKVSWNRCASFTCNCVKTPLKMLCGHELWVILHIFRREEKLLAKVAYSQETGIELQFPLYGCLHYLMIKFIILLLTELVWLRI